MDNKVKEKDKHGIGAFIVAGTSFIPLIGIFTGIICIVIAIVGKKSNSKLLGGLGFAGIMLSIILYGTLFYKISNDGGFSKGFEVHAINAMTSLVRDIEYYKLQHGNYPESLDVLRESLTDSEIPFPYDISGPINGTGQQRDYYYNIVNEGKNYKLFGIGQDATPFTSDDIFPIIDPEKDKNIGWVKKP